jgi:chlorobactene glucosyltransferase
LSFLVQHQFSIVVFLGVLLAISLSNLVTLHRLGGRGFGKRRNRLDLQPETLPRVSVLVPARNEERNIARCVRSLLAQDYADFEVIVLDDSEDRTPDILQSLAGDERLRVVAGKPLPAGWMGKNWSCHQLAQAATGKILLFTDADTCHHPSMLLDAVTALSAERSDFLSAIPRQELHTWAERLILPILPWSLHTFFPIGLARRFRLRALATAAGQLMLFRKEAYAVIGGHQGIRESVLDDVSLAQHVVKAGLPWSLMDGKARISVRMYRSSREVWDGLSKNLFAVFGCNLPLFCFVWAWLLWVAWEPPLVLVLRATRAVSIPAEVVIPAALATGLCLLLWLISNLRFRIPWIQAALHPVTMLLVLSIAVRSVIWHALGRGTWKGRPLRPVDGSGATKQRCG